MSDKEKNEIKPRPHKNDPWGKFLNHTLVLDINNDKPFGYHWFWGLYHLSNTLNKTPKFKLATIQNNIPDEHWLKNIDSHDAPNYLNTFLEVLLKGLGEPKEIKVIDFSELNIGEYTRLSDSIQPLFSNFIFPIEVRFQSVTFSASVFNNAVFFETVFFNYTEFSSSAIFSNAIFFGEAYFLGTRFAIDARFDEVEFRSLATFSGAILPAGTTFSKTKFFSRASFEEVKFSYGVNFKKTIFYHDVLFDDATFKATANFTGAKFKNMVPNFYDTKISTDIIWQRNVNFWPNTTNWIDCKTDEECKESDEEYKERMIDNEKAYENLSACMKKMDKYHDQHFFYRQEMRCRQRLEKNPFIRFPNIAYEWIADYGYGFGYALSWWFGHIFIGALFIGATTKSVSNKTCDLAGDFYLDMIVSFSNAHGVLFFSNGLLKECYDTFKMLLAFKFIWGIQTILGIIFLFLVLLTLRVRFRLK